LIVFWVFLLRCALASHLPSKSQKPLSLSRSRRENLTKPNSSAVSLSLSLRRLVRPPRPPTEAAPQSPQSIPNRHKLPSLAPLFNLCRNPSVRFWSTSCRCVTSFPIPSCLLPLSVSLSNTSLLAIYFYACLDPLKTARKLGFPP